MAPEKHPLDNFDFEGIYEEFRQAQLWQRTIATEIQLSNDQKKDKEEIEDNYIRCYFGYDSSGYNLFTKEKTARNALEDFTSWKKSKIATAALQLKPIYESITLTSLSERVSQEGEGLKKIAQRFPEWADDYLEKMREAKRFALIHEFLLMASYLEKVPDTSTHTQQE